MNKTLKLLVAFFLSIIVNNAIAMVREGPTPPELPEPTYSITIESLFQIFNGNNLIQLNILPRDTVGDIKATIRRLTGIPVEKQTIIFRHAKLKNSVNNLEPNMTYFLTFRKELATERGFQQIPRLQPTSVTLPAPSERKYIITIRALNPIFDGEKTIQKTVNRENTIRQMKQELAEKYQLPLEKIKIIYSGNLLSDTSHIPTDTIFLVIRN